MVQVTNITTPLDVNDPHYQDWYPSLLPESRAVKKPLWKGASKLLKKTLQNQDVDLQAVFQQGFEMANILAMLQVNNSTLIAAILYPFVEKGLIDIEQVDKSCSRRIANQLKGVASMDAIRSLQSDFADQQDDAHIDNLRKMLLVMVDDVRVVLLKLAERLYLLRRAVKIPGEESLLIGREIRDVYAPLANRLGVGQIKWEMEDLSFRILNNKEYLRLAKMLAEKREAREKYISLVLQQIGDALKPVSIKADLQGRVKHIFSIWKKMQRKQVDFDDIYDVRAVRVLVPEIQDCYSVLGCVHGLWKHIPKEFDDYIATPKENGYRSLHTAVIGPKGKTLEIQIRTFDMHQESELGVAAHWKYKEGKGAPADGYEAKIAWLRQLLEWQDEVSESADLVEEFRHQVLEERIYVFTPQGKLIDLPQGSTALDFAYRVHTEIGHRCRGAKVNGSIVSLTQALQTGQKVEVLTHKTGEPSRDWLNPHSGYIKSSRARHKIQQWFRHQDKDKNAAAGKVLLEKELQKHNLQASDHKKLAKHFNYIKEDELYAGIGVGDKGLHQVLNAARSMLELSQPVNPESIVKKPSKTSKKSASTDILVEGVGNLLTRIAGCCKPLPGDSIAGYVTQGRGIMIHRADCHYLTSAKKSSPEKVLQVEWSGSVKEQYLIDLLIKAYDRQGLLNDITALMTEEKVRVTSLKSQVSQKRLMVNTHLQIEVSCQEVAARVMSRLESLPNIISVQRK